MSERANGTGKGLIEFLEWVGSSGEVNRSTANAYRTGTLNVLEIGGPDGESGDELDMVSLDIDNHLDRFTRLKAGDYKTSSLNTYKTRFRNAVEMYRKWLENPASPAWKADLRERRATKSKKEAEVSADEAIPPTSPNGSSGNKDGNLELLEYPFPLKEGGTAYLKLPHDLHTSDVERMTKFLQSLAIDPPAELPTGEIVSEQG